MHVFICTQLLKCWGERAGRQGELGPGSHQECELKVKGIKEIGSSQTAWEKDVNPQSHSLGE